MLIDIAKTLRKLRIQHDYTQGEIAELCNVSRQAVAKWESGINLPDVEKIVELSKLFNISIDELLNINDDNSEKSKNSEYNRCAENEKIINQALENSMNCKNPDEGITQFISYIGEQIGFDRIFIFEANPDGSYKNTYEWCNKGIVHQKEYLQNIPPADISSWTKIFSNGGHICITNLDDLAKTEPDVYRWLKPQGIKSVLAYPLSDCKSFIGVDNPAPAFIAQTSTLMEIMTHFVENMLQRRDLKKELNWAVFQNNQISMFNKTISYRVNLVTGLIEFDNELAKKAGYYFEPGTLDKVKNLCKQHKEFYDHAMFDGFERAVETKENVSIEFVSYIDDIHLRWNKLTISPFFDSNGNVTQLCGILQDVSENHIFIEHYNKYVLKLSGGFHVCYLSRPVHLEYASSNLYSFLGYTKEEFEQVAGTRYTNIMVEEDKPVFRAYYKRLAEKPGTESCKYRLIKKDGTIVSVIDTMESVIDGSGIMYGYAYVLPESDMHTLLEMKEDNEKVHLAQLNQQYAVFETLGKEYQDIYRVWLDEDKAQVVRLNGYITKILDKNSTEYIPYYRVCKQYIHQRVHPDDRQKMLEATNPNTVRKALEQSDEYSVIYRALEKEKTHYFQMVYSRLYDTNDKSKINFIAGFKNVDQLIEEEHSNNEKLQEQIDIINTILKAFTCGYYMEYANDTYTELSNTDERMSKLIGKSGHFSENREKMKYAFPDKKAYKEVDDFLNVNTLKDRLENQHFITTQVEIKGFGWYEMYMFIVDYDENGKISHSILLAKDITEEKKQEKEFEHSLSVAARRERDAIHKAYIDALTGALNRNAFEEDFAHIGDNNPVGFIFCDINNLKQTNDSLGHRSGDKLLVDFVKLLRQYFSADSIYRTGGDEFVCTIEHISEYHFKERVTKVRKAVEKFDNIASIGAAYGNSKEKDSLMRKAEVQMYELKNRYHFGRE